MYVSLVDWEVVIARPLGASIGGQAQLAHARKYSIWTYMPLVNNLTNMTALIVEAQEMYRLESALFAIQLETPISTNFSRSMVRNSLLRSMPRNSTDKCWRCAFAHNHRYLNTTSL